MKAFILETAAKATAETLRRGEIPFQKLQHQESQRTSPRHLAVPHSMKMWEPLVRPLTPERRLVVSTDALRSPLGTAAPTFQPHFQRNSIRTKTPRLQGSLPSSGSLIRCRHFGQSCHAAAQPGQICRSREKSSTRSRVISKERWSEASRDADKNEQPGLSLQPPWQVPGFGTAL